MDLSRSRRPQHGQAMRADGDLAGRAVLRPGGREPGEPEADAPAGRVHADAVLRGPSDEAVAGGARLWGERETSAAAFAADGIGSDLSEAAAVCAGAGPSDLSLSPAGVADRSTEPGLGERHNVYSSASRVYLSGGDSGLVQSVRAGLGSVGFVGGRVLPGGTGVGPEDGVPGLRPESCWNDCLTRRKSIRPCVPSHVAYEAGAARQRTVRSPRTTDPRSQEGHRTLTATGYLPA